jgi:hypothetical protein
MPANINAYIGREAAWHRLGTVTGHHMTWTEVQGNGGLDYVVFKSQLHDGSGWPVDAWGTFRWNRADKLAGNREAAVFLGVVGEDYGITGQRLGTYSLSSDGTTFTTTSLNLYFGSKVTVQVEERMHFDGGLVLAESSPGKQRQAEIDGGGIQGV